MCCLTAQLHMLRRHLPGMPSSSLMGTQRASSASAEPCGSWCWSWGIAATCNTKQLPQARAFARRGSHACGSSCKRRPHLDDGIVILYSASWVAADDICRREGVGLCQGLVACAAGRLVRVVAQPQAGFLCCFSHSALRHGLARCVGPEQLRTHHCTASKAVHPVPHLSKLQAAAWKAPSA